MTIVHREHGAVTVQYPEEILSGKNYTMELVFEGKDVSFVTSAPGAALTIDGTAVGNSPQTLYLAYGVHTVEARKGPLFYEGTVNVTQDGPGLFDLEMQDENKLYSDVTVTVGDNASIWHEGKQVGIGSWRTRLREGQYVVETRKQNHDNRQTTFRVVAGRDTTIRVASPDPYRGWLRLATIPETGVSILAGDTIFTEDGDVQLPVGSYELTFARRGYNPQTRLYRVERNSEILDTIVLRKKQYVRSTGGFVGAAGTYGTIPGVSIFAGGTFRDIMLEAFYTFGLKKTDPVSWFAVSNGLYDETVNYSMNEFGVRLGYQLKFVERIGLTPQAGFMAQMLKSHSMTGNDGETGAGIRGDKTWCGNLTIGARVCYTPYQNMSIFMTPEYAIPIVKKTTYEKIAPIAGITKGGFYLHAGLTVNF